MSIARFTIIHTGKCIIKVLVLKYIWKCLNFRNFENQYNNYLKFIRNTYIKLVFYQSMYALKLLKVIEIIIFNNKTYLLAHTIDTIIIMDRYF